MLRSWRRIRCGGIGLATQYELRKLWGPGFVEFVDAQLDGAPRRRIQGGQGEAYIGGGRKKGNRRSIAARAVKETK